MYSMRRTLLPLLVAAVLLLLAPPRGVWGAAESSSSSRFEGASSEEAAIAQLKQQQQQQQQQQQNKEQQSQQQQLEQELQDDAEFALQRGWFKLAQEIILHSHTVGVDVGYRVRRVVMNMRNELLEVERLLSKQHDAIAVMSPAFQWAESPIEVFLNIKFAYRWSSPGALSLEDSSISSTSSSFTFVGLAQHSGVKRQYRLHLKLFKDILPDKTKWNFASVGKVVVTLKKKEVGLWSRLTADTAKIANMNVWLDMREKVQKDVDAFLAGNYTVPGDAEGVDEGQQQQQQQQGDAQKGEEL